MKVIAVLNEKGGVAKTTLSATLSCGLAALQNRVVYVDTDEQGHGAVALGLAKGPKFFDLMQRNAKWADVLTQVPPEKFLVPGTALSQGGELYVLPSNVETRVLPQLIRPEGLHLRRRLQQLESVVDYVIIDTGPAAGMMHILIYSAADYVLFPTKTEELSFDGLLEAMAHMDGASLLRQGLNLPPVEALGIVPTLYRGTTLEHKINKKALEDQFGDLVWNPIAERAVWSESLASASGHTPVYAHAPNTEAAAEAWDFIKRVQNTIEGVRHEQSA